MKVKPLSGMSFLQKHVFAATFWKYRILLLLYVDIDRSNLMTLEAVAIK